MAIQLRRGLSPVRLALGNGAILLVQQTEMAPAVTIDCTFDAGSLFDPSDLPGVSQLVGRVLERGTTRRSANTIAEELDERGVALRINTTRHRLSVSGTCLTEDFPDVLALLLDVVRRPSFPIDEIEQPRGETITAFRQDDEYGRAGRGRSRGVALWRGPSLQPQGQGHGGRCGADRSGRSGSVPPPLGSALKPGADDRRRHRAVGRACAGHVRARRLVGTRSHHVPVPSPVPPTSRRVSRAIMPSKPQADIAYGFNTIRRLDPRYHAYWMMNNVLGQFGLGGRLADNIRERQGMAYYVYSTFDASVGEGPLLVRAGVDPANVGRTIAAIDDEVRRLGQGGPTPAEVAETCEYLVGSIPRFLETNHGIAAFLHTSERYGLGLDYDRRLPGLLRAVTLDEIGAAAAEVLNPDVASIGIAGPAEATDIR